MARPLKLTEKQWKVIEQRIPPLGKESMRAIAREFCVSEGVIRRHVKAHTKPINVLANQLARAEIALESLPIKTQVKVRSLADSLKGISVHLAGAAEYGAMTAHRLASIANIEVQKVDETAPMESIDQLKGVAALTDLVNKASAVGLNLLAANKDMIKDNSDGAPASLSEFYGSEP